MWQRVYRLIMEPERTWREIKQEQQTTAALFRGYAGPLALLPVLSMLGRLLLRGQHLTWPSLFDLLTIGLVNYLLLLGAVLFSGWIVSLMAPYFYSKADLPAAIKVVIYSMTPVWLAGVFQLVTRLGALALLGFYGAFLLYISLPVLLDTPPDKQTGFAATIIVFGLVVLMFLSVGGAGALYL